MKKILTILSLLSIVFIQGQNPSTVFGDTIEPGYIEVSENNYIYLNNVENPVTLNELKAKMMVLDDYDGDLSSSITISIDNYSVNMDILGDHIIIFEVVDSGGASSSIIITVRNIDIGSPELVLLAESSLKIPQYSHLGSNLPRISAIDKHEGDITSDININGLELIDTTVLGTYELTYSVTDASGNFTTKNFFVEVVDATNPELEGPSHIVKRSDVILDGQFYLTYFTADDDIDGIISNKITVSKDGYTGNANNPGDYYVTVSVEDNEGNETTKVVHIEVVKEMIPQLIIDDYYWVIENDHYITDKEFISILQFIGDLPKDEFIFSSTYDNYTDSYSVTDRYSKSFGLLSETGEEFEKSIIIDVVSTGSNIIEKPDSGYEKNKGIIWGVVASVTFVGLVFIGIKQTKK